MEKCKVIMKADIKKENFKGMFWKTVDISHIWEDDNGGEINYDLMIRDKYSLKNSPFFVRYNYARKYIYIGGKTCIKMRKKGLVKAFDLVSSYKKMKSGEPVGGYTVGGILLKRGSVI